MFLSYTGVKGYQLWLLDSEFKKSIIQIDVIFNETEMSYKPRVPKCKHRSSCGGDKANIKVQSSTIEVSDVYNTMH